MNETGNIYKETNEFTVDWLERRIKSINEDLKQDEHILTDPQFHFLKGELSALNQVYRLLTA